MMIVQSGMELERSGVTRSMRTHAVRTGRWERPTRNTYILDPNASPEQIWLATLDYLVRKFGPSSGASHRAAAIIHRFDGFAKPHEFARAVDPWPKDVLVPIAVGSGGGIRTRRAIELSNHHGLSVTTIARTLADLGRFVSLDHLELAVESALRGPDPTDPFTWNRALLAQLELLATDRNSPGRKELRQVLARRPPGANPTGSLAETIALQGFRAQGFGGLLRQPEVQILDLGGRIRHTFYPDFADLIRGLLIEIDGIVGHTGEKLLQRDDRRQNLLQPTFHIVRYRAALVLADPISVGIQARRVWDSMAPESSPENAAYQQRIRRTARGCQIQLNL